MDKNFEKNLRFDKRHYRVRNKVHGTAERPRLSVYRSLKNIYVQLIDDDAGKTLATVSTLMEGFRSKEKKTSVSVDMARKIGARVSEVAKEKKITKVVFDKSGYKYHGRIKALADAAREVEARRSLQLCHRRPGQRLAPAPSADAQARAGSHGCAAGDRVRYGGQLHQGLGWRRQWL